MKHKTKKMIIRENSPIFNAHYVSDNIKNMATKLRKKKLSFVSTIKAQREKNTPTERSAVRGISLKTVVIIAFYCT